MIDGKLQQHSSCQVQLVEVKCVIRNTSSTIEISIVELVFEPPFCAERQSFFLLMVALYENAKLLSMLQYTSTPELDRSDMLRLRCLKATLLTLIYTAHNSRTIG